ncbi:hypothetical protein V1511DRAFT_491455 [Dipodascopsis uninucleata]
MGIKRTKPKEGRKRHRFVSFRDRIDSIKIDPLRKARQQIEVGDKSTESFFHVALLSWREMNSTKCFTDFFFAVRDISQSLPQVLYHKQKIFDEFEKSISLKDQYSLQPLLDLLTNFAHDLGPEFEEFFPRAAKVLVDATNHEEIVVVEWTFNCMAYLFKYLFKVLMNDLAAIFDLLFPMLLQSQRKPHLARFGAESFSFFLRNSKSVDIEPFISHVFEKITESKSKGLRESVPLLFSEALKGPEGTLHSKSPRLLLKLQNYCSIDYSDEKLVVFISILSLTLHHVSSETSQPLYDTLLGWMDRKLEDDKCSMKMLRMIIVELFVMAGLRKGSRVPDWGKLRRVYQRLVVKLANFSRSSDFELAVWELGKVTYCIIQYCELSDAEVTSIIENIYSIDNSKEFLLFVHMLLDLNIKDDSLRICSFYLRRYINDLNSIDDYIEMVLIEVCDKLAGKLNRNDSLIQPNEKFFTVVTKRMQFLLQHEDLANTERLQQVRLLLDTIYRLGFSHNLLDIIKTTFVKSITLLETPENFLLIGSIIGRCVSLLSSMHNETSLKEANVIESVFVRFSVFRKSSTFIIGVRNWIENNSNDMQLISLNDLTLFVRELSDNLTEQSNDLRLQSLLLLRTIFRKLGTPCDVLDNCISVEETEFGVSTARALSMHIRRIGLDFALITDDLVRETVIKYCYGILKSPYQPVWEEAIKTIIAIYPKQKDRFWHLTFSGIVDAMKEEDGGSLISDVLGENKGPSSIGFHYKFECTNLEFINGIANSSFMKRKEFISWLSRFSRISDSYELKVQKLMISHRCFQVLNAVSSIAEQKSANLKPLFFNSISNGCAVQRSILIDIMKLFSSFDNCKMSLGEEVYNALYLLLSSPDTEIQKQALSCVFAWNDSSINIYRENLKRLLDPRLYSEEINNLIITGDETTVISIDHRSKIYSIVVRLLYGNAIGFHGSNNGKAKTNHRMSIISVIVSLPSQFILEFTKLAAGGLPPAIGIDFEGLSYKLPDYSLVHTTSDSLRKIVGFMSMGEDILETMKSKLGDSSDYLLQNILSCIAYAQNLIDGDSSDEIMILARSIRSSGSKCLEAIFTDITFIDFNRYCAAIFNIVIRPRMIRFKDENSQDISPAMRIFLLWSSSDILIDLFAFDDTILSIVLETLDANNVKSPIFIAIITMMGNFLDLAMITENKKQSSVLQTLLTKTMPLFIPKLVRVLSERKTKDILEVGISVLRKCLATGVMTDADGLLLEQYISVCLTVLDSKTVSYSSMEDIFEVLSSLVSTCGNSIILEKCYEELSPLLKSVKDRHSRTSLVKIFRALGQKSQNLVLVGTLLTDMNSYSKKRLDEPDYDRILSAFSRVNGELYRDMSATQFAPVLYQSIFYLMNGDEITILKHASLVLKRFIEITSSKLPEDGIKFHSLVESVIVQALRSGLRMDAEISRNEMVEILRYLVQNSSAYPRVSSMACLLIDGDEEADFFLNITHIQSHRRQRAIYRLGQISLVNDLGDYNIAQFLLPLMEHFLKNVTTATSSMAEEAISTIGKLSLGLSWNQYQAVVKRCIINLENNRDNVRFYSRLLESISGAVYKGYSPLQEMKKQHNQAKVSSFLVSEVIPKLREIIKLTEESRLTDRVSVTIPLVKFLTATSEDVLISNLSSIVLELSQHLKNRLQDIRDNIRKVFTKICVLIGPRCLGLMLRQMQTVLKRGSQKHVLSYTTHSLLIGTLSSESTKHGDLDDCLDQVMDICMDDILGSAASEKDAEEYRSKMKEVNENKSYDSIELLAKNIHANKIESMILPIKDIVKSETLTIKAERKINEVLRHISLGLNQNEEGCSKYVIELCLRICSMSQLETADRPKRQVSALERKKERFLMQKNKKNVPGSKGQANNIHYLQRFALEVVKNCLKKNRALIEGFELQQFLISLKAFLTSRHDDIALSSLKLLATAAKYSKLLNQLDTTYIFEHIVLITQNASTITSEVCQTGLKLLAILIKQSRHSADDNASIAFILKKIELDLIEPDKQSHSLLFLKAIMNQKIMVSEIYDLIDKVREIMVNSQVKVTREVCRSLYVQFLMDYPQGRGRFNNQLRFLVHNLNYPHASGRESILEVIYLLLSKLNDDAIQNMIELLYVPLTMVLVNDDSSECREMTSLLFSTIIQKANKDNLHSILSNCEDWKLQDQSVELANVASQLFESIQEREML